MGLFSKQTDEQKKAKQQAQQEIFESKIADHLIEDEKVLYIGMVLNDFAFVSNKRVGFIDNSLATTRKNEMITIPLKAIIEVAVDSNFSSGDLRITTTHKEYSIALDSESAKLFQNALLNLIL